MQVDNVFVQQFVCNCCALMCRYNRCRSFEYRYVTSTLESYAFCKNVSLLHRCLFPTPNSHITKLAACDDEAPRCPPNRPYILLLVDGPSVCKARKLPQPKAIFLVRSDQHGPPLSVGHATHGQHARRRVLPL